LGIEVLKECLKASSTLKMIEEVELEAKAEKLGLD
jgi:hypothetical protein